MEPVTVAATALVVGGVATHTSRNPVLRARWRTWLFALPTVFVPLLVFGQWGAIALAVVLGAVAALELARLAELSVSDTATLVALIAAVPLVGARFHELVLVIPLIAALPALLQGDAERGLRRTAVVAFGAFWIGGGLLGIVILDPTTVTAVCLGVAFADVGAWCAGKSLGRRGVLAQSLSRHSPSKTYAGVLGSLAGAAVVLAILDQMSLLVAVGIGSVLGDLLESMVKRGCGRKDAGTWLPGFGGLLDRIDSLLIALPLAVVLS